MISSSNKLSADPIDNWASVSYKGRRHHLEDDAPSFWDMFRGFCCCEAQASSDYLQEG